MDIGEELKSAGAYPSGPCSAWPESRNEELMAKAETVKPRTTYVNSQFSNAKSDPSAGKMARGLLKTAGQALRHGKVSKEIREERYDTCKACPFFNAESKRCNDCGCFMEAKTWVGGDPDALCPQKKWSR